jgi:hypothetical protein
MPRVGQTKRNEQAARPMFVRWEQFADRVKWHKNHKGSLVRTWDGKTLTIFWRGGYWHWCMAGDGEPRYSEDVFETVGEARGSLCDELIC